MWLIKAIERRSVSVLRMMMSPFIMEHIQNILELPRDCLRKGIVLFVYGSFGAVDPQRRQIKFILSPTSD